MNELECFYDAEGHVDLYRNPGQGYNTPLLRLKPTDLSIACPHRQSNTLPSLLHNLVAISKSNHHAWLQRVFDMSRLGREPKTYRMRGRQPYLKTMPMRFLQFWLTFIQYDISTEWMKLLLKQMIG